MGIFIFPEGHERDRGGIGLIATIADALPLAALLLPLYTRVRAADALEHATRGRIVERLHDAPGATRRELAQAVGVPVATIAYHLDMLLALGVVHARREGRELVHFAGAPPATPRALVAPPRAELARLLAAAPLTQGELAAHTGWSQRLVAYHLARMTPFVQDDGGRPRRYSLAAPVRS